MDDRPSSFPTITRRRSVRPLKLSATGGCFAPLESATFPWSPDRIFPTVARSFTNHAAADVLICRSNEARQALPKPNLAEPRSAGQMRTSVPTWFMVARVRAFAPTSIFLCYTPEVFCKSHFPCPEVIRMKFRALGLLTAAVVFGLFRPCVAGAQTASTALHPISIDDYFQVREVADLQISPDGQWVAYTVSTQSLQDDEEKTRIWMVPEAGGDAVAMTSEEVSSDHPRWSPDGKYLAFLSKRDEGKTYVWLLNRLGGEAEPLVKTA